MNMKELTIEEKAKRYDEAIEKAKDYYNKGRVPEFCNYIASDIFPELKKKTDKEMIQKLITVVHLYYGEGVDAERDECLKWLKKQNNKLQGKSALEAIKEEKIDNANKVEPKFKVGDWIVNNITKDVFLIKSFNSGYCTLEDVKGNIISPCLPPCESESHLWSIEDAKDGDVLVASDGSIFLFKGAVGRACKHYVALTADGVVVINEGLEHFWETSTAVHPATKEQRDLLFQKMKDAGYKWNPETKELNRLDK